MYGREPTFNAFSDPTAFDATTYQGHLQAKLAELRDFVQANLTEAAARQQTEFNKRSRDRTFEVGQPVWLSRPTAGKLDPRWEGRWTVKSVKSPVTVEIADEQRRRVVHINRLRHRVSAPADGRQETAPWTPPQTEHYVISDADPPSPLLPPAVRRYPSRTRN